MKPVETYIPRIALFLSEPEILVEMERLLKAQYSSLLIITERDKLKQFPIPLIVVVDAVKSVSELRALHPVEGTRVLLVNREDSEEVAAAFDVGVDDFITYPFSPDDVLSKFEKYLEPFRQPA
jgi:DNA-binding response OmpR family regulator